jgi:hypothetical protein
VGWGWGCGGGVAAAASGAGGPHAIPFLMPQPAEPPTYCSPTCWPPTLICPCPTTPSPPGGDHQGQAAAQQHADLLGAVLRQGEALPQLAGGRARLGGVAQQVCVWGGGGGGGVLKGRGAGRAAPGVRPAKAGDAPWAPPLPPLSTPTHPSRRPSPSRSARPQVLGHAHPHLGERGRRGDPRDRVDRGAGGGVGQEGAAGRGRPGGGALGGRAGGAGRQVGRRWLLGGGPGRSRSWTRRAKRCGWAAGARAAPGLQSNAAAEHRSSPARTPCLGPPLISPHLHHPPAYPPTQVTDLHRHFIDDITIPSKMGKGQLRRVGEPRPPAAAPHQAPNCGARAGPAPLGSAARRASGYALTPPPLPPPDDVFDCWFESGSMPYGQLHYPFENRWGAGWWGSGLGHAPARHERQPDAAPTAARPSPRCALSPRPPPPLNPQGAV